MSSAFVLQLSPAQPSPTQVAQLSPGQPGGSRDIGGGEVRDGRSEIRQQLRRSGENAGRSGRRHSE
eukprot:5898428-Alexandrium_andersonii.AAC.1